MGGTQNFLQTEKNESGWGKTQKKNYIDSEKCLEVLVKLVIASYRLGKMSEGFGETGYS